MVLNLLLTLPQVALYSRAVSGTVRMNHPGWYLAVNLLCSGLLHTTTQHLSGWLFYYFDTGSGDNELALRYARMETEVSVIGGPEGGSSYTIPAENFDIAF